MNINYQYAPIPKNVYGLVKYGRNNISYQGLCFYNGSKRRESSSSSNVFLTCDSSQINETDREKKRRDKMIPRDPLNSRELRDLHRSPRITKKYLQNSQVNLKAILSEIQSSRVFPDKRCDAVSVLHSNRSLKHLNKTEPVIDYLEKNPMREVDNPKEILPQVFTKIKYSIPEDRNISVQYEMNIAERLGRKREDKEIAILLAQKLRDTLFEIYEYFKNGKKFRAIVQELTHQAFPSNTKMVHFVLGQPLTDTNETKLQFPETVSFERVLEFLDKSSIPIMSNKRGAILLSKS